MRRHVSIPEREFYQPPRKHRKWILVIAVLIIGGIWWSRDKATSLDINIVTPLTPKKQVLGGKLLQVTPVASLTPVQVDTQSRVVYNTDSALQLAKYPVDQYNITYTSTDPRTDKQIEVTGRAYLPSGAGKGPLMVFGPGTTGPGPLCAPTLEKTRAKNWGRYDNLLSFYAGQGYAVAMTDYPFRSGEAAISTYFIGEAEGRAMLDLARTMKSFKSDSKYRSSPVGDQIFYSGYSQGGHAALWAEKVRSKYAPEINNSGVVLFAPATDLHKTFYDSVYGATTVWLPAYLYAAYLDYYGMKTPASQIFNEPFASSIELDARDYCIDDVEPSTTGKKYFGTSATAGKLFTPEFIAALRARNVALVSPEWSKLMQQNLAGEPIDPPVLVISGKSDLVILSSAQKDLAKRICKDGTANLQWEESTENHYTRMFSKGRSKVLGWMAGISSGTQPVSQCSVHRS